MDNKGNQTDLRGVITTEDLKRIISEVIQEHQCVLNSETVALLNDPENREVIRTIAKGLTPNSASMLARFGRMIDQVEFSIGKLILRGVILSAFAVVAWLALEKVGVKLGK